jgi:hypothetical protein
LQHRFAVSIEVGGVRNLALRLLHGLALEAVSDLLEHDHRPPRVLRGLEESPCQGNPERKPRECLLRIRHELRGDRSVIIHEDSVEAANLTPTDRVGTAAKDFAGVAVRAALKGSPGSSPAVASLLDASGERRFFACHDLALSAP